MPPHMPPVEPPKIVSPYEVDVENINIDDEQGVSDDQVHLELTMGITNHCILVYF